MIGHIRGGFRLGCIAAVSAGLMTVVVGVGHADTPSPTPSASAEPSVSPTPTASPSPSPTGTPVEPTAAPTPTATPSPSTTTPTASPETEQPRRAEAAPGLSLTVRSTYGTGTAFWSDLGSYAFRGSASGLASGSRIDVYYRVGSGSWKGLVSGTTAGGEFEIDKIIGGHGTFTFAATTGGAPGTGDAVASNLVTVTVGNSRVVMNRPVATIDALKDPRLSGSVVPARSGVNIHVDLLRNGRFVKIAETRTDAGGRWAMNLSYRHGSLATFRLRAAYRAQNRPVWETSTSHSVSRVAVLNAVTRPTSAADVAKTYRAGCPVGRSRLSTITMNYYGMDQKMHRGVMIVRSDLAGHVRYAFSRSISARFPINKMVNPNAYGGNDPAQMRADNTSGFNCRAVVGNPYRRSPHSYGIAIDVNPRQNPYRDATGKWWPENGREYIDRTPRRGGMLTTGSTLTRVLRDRGFFWGGLWSPGRDYQHFEH